MPDPLDFTAANIEKPCVDTRFEQAGPPEGCDPKLDIIDPKLKAEVSADNALAGFLDKDAVSDPLGTCPPKEPSTEKSTTQGNKTLPSQATQPDGPYVMSLTEITELCTRFPSPQTMTGIILQLLIYHFSDASRIFLDELKTKVWTATPKTNSLRITTNTRWSPKDADQVPAIIISREKMAMSRMVIGDADVKHGEEELFTRKVDSLYKIVIIGGTDAETELLGFEVNQFFTVFSPALRRRTPIYNLEVLEVSPLTAVEELGNRLAVSVILKLEYPWTWSLQEVAPILKSTTIKV